MHQRQSLIQRLLGSLSTELKLGQDSIESFLPALVAGITTDISGSILTKKLPK